jgi:hypothetical protein
MPETRVTKDLLVQAAENGVFDHKLVVIIGETKTGKTQLLNALFNASTENGCKGVTYAIGKDMDDAIEADYAYATIVGEPDVYLTMRAPVYTPVGDLTRKYYEVLFEEPGWGLESIKASCALEHPEWPELEEVLSRAAVYPQATFCCSAEKMQFIEVIGYEPMFCTTDPVPDECRDWWIDFIATTTSMSDSRGYYKFSRCNKQVDGEEWVPFEGEVFVRVSEPFVIEAEYPYTSLAEADREYARLAAEYVHESPSL